MIGSDCKEVSQLKGANKNDLVDSTGGHLVA